MPKDYNPSIVEPKWQKRWEEAGVHRVDLQKAKQPYCSLVMFPYPSGDKLHVGHWYNFAPADSYSRYMQMHGHDVFEPMGFDAFGLPAENYAIKSGIPPAKSTADNVRTMIRQLKRIGCMYDWEKMVNTSEPEYYRWTQWLFLQMYGHGLAYKKEGNVNFCPSCQTVLANEQVWEGKCERCGTEVVQKTLPQWYWKITKYAQKLLDNLDGLEWPEKTKLMQRNWIDRSAGVTFAFSLKGSRRGVIGFDARGMNSPGVGSPHHPANEFAGYPRTGFAGSEFGLSEGEFRIDSGSGGGFPNDEGSRRFQPPAASDAYYGRIHSPMRIVHVVFTPHSRESAFASEREASRILRILDSVANRHDITIHEAAAMPDHVHLLVSFRRDRDLHQDIVKKLKGASAWEFLKPFGGGTLWGEGVHHENVDTPDNFDAVVQYIQNNPSKEGISAKGRILSRLPLQFHVYDSIPQTFKAQTFVVIAPEHPLVYELVKGTKQEKTVMEFVERIKKKKAVKRFNFQEDVEGVDTGRVVENPFGMGDLPIWVASFVVMEYGTGIVSCSAHDERDFVFAKKYGIPLRPVMFPDDPKEAEKVRNLHYCYTKDPEGILEYPEEFRGRRWDEARGDIITFIVEKGYGERQVNYRLRDWLISRQRYWGAPIPIVYDPEGKPHPIPEKHLPWLLPTDVEFKPTGKSPLTDSKEFIARTEKIFGKGWRPEFDTMDTFVCSSFYYLRYLATRNAKSETVLVDPEIEKRWMPVSMYIGGPEHACMHLIYARFVMMALKDFGHVSHEEPFKKLVHQGLITNKGAKMSKSKGNVVSPDSFIEKHGSDVFRMYLMFMGPFTDGGDWSDTGIKGIDRFVQRVWKIFGEKQETEETKENDDVRTALHRTIKKVTESMNRMHFNTAISALMEFLNAIEGKSFSKETAMTFTKLIAPLAPHLADELGEALGGKGFIVDQKWPSFDPKLLQSDTMTIMVQVNGKVRANIEVASNAAEKDILAAAKADANVQKFLGGNAPKKEIYIKGKLVSLVV